MGSTIVVNKRNGCKKYLKKHVDFELRLYGSAASGLCCKKSSDIDITILVNDFDICHEKILEVVKENLEKCSLATGRYMLEPYMPRRDKAGYILKAYDAIDKLRIDIMVNKVAEIMHA